MYDKMNLEQYGLFGLNSCIIILVNTATKKLYCYTFGILIHQVFRLWKTQRIF